MSINGPKLLFMNGLVIYLCFYGLKVAEDVIGSFQSTYEISKTLSNLAQKDEKHKNMKIPHHLFIEINIIEAHFFFSSINK